MERVATKREVWLRALVSLTTGIVIFSALATVALFLQFLADYVTDWDHFQASLKPLLT